MEFCLKKFSISCLEAYYDGTWKKVRDEEFRIHLNSEGVSYVVKVGRGLADVNQKVSRAELRLIEKQGGQKEGS